MYPKDAICEAEGGQDHEDLIYKLRFRIVCVHSTVGEFAELPRIGEWRNHSEAITYATHHVLIPQSTATHRLARNWGDNFSHTFIGKHSFDALKQRCIFGPSDLFLAVAPRS